MLMIEICDDQSDVLCQEVLKRNLKAKRFTKEASKSNIESVKEAKITVEELTNQTASLIKINKIEVQTDATPARITSFL